MDKLDATGFEDSEMGSWRKLNWKGQAPRGYFGWWLGHADREAMDRAFSVQRLKMVNKGLLGHARIEKGKRVRRIAA